MIESGARAEKRFALGVGLTNACNLRCAHCYRSTGEDELGVDEVLDAALAIPTRAVNFGTGENGLHADFPRAVEELVKRGISVTMTTNGYSAEALPDRLLATMSDVEFSIDYPDRIAHDAARGAGNWDLIEAQMDRCRRLGVSTTIVSVLMSENANALPSLARLAGERAALLRVNVYQAVHNAVLALGFVQFWEAWRALFAVADLVTCGEPILRAVLGLPAQAGAGCGVQTVRITPRGAVVPCVYGGDAELGIADLHRLGEAIVEHPAFTRLRVIPEPCTRCPHVEACRGGCASRRLLRGGLDRADEYCPILRGEDMRLDVRLADLGRIPPKAASACTVIVKPRS
jgi:radical SAM protein with 4Fe4S-binding SPASM domain